MKNASDEFRMDRYGQRPPFASFLPGLAGLKGVPVWCYYVNRGQGVVSFGVDNKDGAIMEFKPAHRAYEAVGRTGFRTFLRRDGAFYEPFARDEEASMTVEMNALRLEDDGGDGGLCTQVDYFVLPEERVGALVRHVRVTNRGAARCRLELLDGMPELIPCGVSDDSMKNMLQTAKAWMQAEDVETGAPFYRVRASIEDSTRVQVVESGVFAAGYDESGGLLRAVADPEAVFAWDTGLARPVVFQKSGLEGVLAAPQHVSNLLPCAFFALERELEPGQSAELWQLIGQARSKKVLARFMAERRDGAWFEGRSARARELVRELCAGVETRTGNSVFDGYCRYTYMDNVLRGGQPVRLGKDKVFYAYSRKHGDLERDYNYFSMLPEPYSQGNGNFRDVAQNRRSDVFFAPFVGRLNIYTFFDLLQLDAHNPLSVDMQSYTLAPERVAVALEDMSPAAREAARPVLAGPFTPGKLYLALAESMQEDAAQRQLERIMDLAEGQVNGSFGEGYWCDHWTYNLDLIQEYLGVFPEQERELLYERAYTYYISQANINPRARRYVVTEAGVRQYHTLDAAGSRTTPEKYLRDERGELVRSTLVEKLALLCAMNFAALDPWGMGVEMEGGKPGWYDALNGLPGMLGSSMAETYELARLLDYTAGALERFPGQVEMLEEVWQVIEALRDVNEACRAELERDGQALGFWNGVNDVKEAYRAKTYENGVTGRRVPVASERLRQALLGFARTVRRGMEKAMACGVSNGGAAGVCPTYFAYEVTDYTEDGDGIHPTAFALVRLPAFLEGPVRAMKLAMPLEEKKRLWQGVRESELYDGKLSMYRVNASLQDASYELGRARAFTPGWLENASIWMHMEYKYLLELLRSGLYEEFFRDFRAAAVPFLDPEVYGRSPLENSSFLASSANPNEKLHGRGFVARLSGSTAEFLSMWKGMLFGPGPFFVEKGELVCRLRPAIPAYLIGEDDAVAARFMSRTWVSYHLPRRRDYIPGEYTVEEIKVRYADGGIVRVAGGELRGALAEDLRQGRIAALDVGLKASE